MKCEQIWISFGIILDQKGAPTMRLIHFDDESEINGLSEPF
ncbi:hypothetical protein MalM14_32770 [Gimesia chilikensis]|nr:hypothetical protein MalM14_32770 [Gimesia chilikensis]